MRDRKFTLTLVLAYLSLLGPSKIFSRPWIARWEQAKQVYIRLIDQARFFFKDNTSNNPPTHQTLLTHQYSQNTPNLNPLFSHSPSLTHPTPPFKPNHRTLLSSLSHSPPSPLSLTLFTPLSHSIVQVCISFPFLRFCIAFFPGSELGSVLQYRTCKKFGIQQQPNRSGI